MSSNETSGASAEAPATNPAPSAEAAFGSTRGSGLARGKGKRHSAPAATAAASAAYTPTAIEVVTAPREYQNPFAPVETPAAAIQETAPAVAPAPAAIVPEVAPVREYVAPVAEESEAHVQAPVESEAQVGINILPPEQQKSTPAQTWESEGFRPAREVRTERPRREEAPRREELSRREEREERTPIDPASIPEKFLYVRPGYNYVPTPSNFGGAPRERKPASAGSPAKSHLAPAAEAPKSSGGFLGWLKSLFGGSPEAAPAEVRNGDSPQGDRPRGGRNRGPGGDSYRRRSRGGRGRSQRNGEYRGGGGEMSG